jgi:hypothetical protein
MRKWPLTVRCLQILWVLICIFLAAGCQEEDGISELTGQSPFKNAPSSPAEEILIVSCQGYPLELPGQVDVMALPFWSEHALAQESGNISASATPAFSAEQLNLWRQNGLHLAVAPLDDWAQFRQELMDAGGRSMSSTISLLRKPTDVAEFPAAWVPQSTSVFIIGSSGIPRGYTLSQGDCLFSVNCVPGREVPQPSSLYTKIVPEFHAALPSERFDRDAFGTLRRIIENPRMVFNQMTLEGQLPKDHFICIAAKTKPITAGNLGQLFLTRTEGTDNYQLVLILVPGLQTGAEVRNFL